MVMQKPDEMIAHLTDLQSPEACGRLVVKVGSALLVGKDGKPRRKWLTGLANEIAQARDRGQEVIIVSSGAIALGAAILGLEKGGRGSLADAQASAAVGQIALSSLWAELLGNHEIVAAQVLITLEDLEGRRRYLNASATLNRLLETGAVPVVNENDTVATHEIRFGDNDRLAARVAQAAKAHAVILLSDIDGLYDKHPSEPGASRIPMVWGVDDEVRAMATGDSDSGIGSGGMRTKVNAVEIAERAGIALVIANGKYDAPIARAIGMHGDDGIGTLFLPRRHDTGRKAWIGGRLRMKGTIVIDEGAVNALRDGNSLLAKGITRVEGRFVRGDPVRIEGPEGEWIAKGLSEYDAPECVALVGLHTDEQEEVLGYTPRSAVVHRDQLVMLR
jgi:glutamate 5-kinase